jgi:hypothetical protein
MCESGSPERRAPRETDCGKTGSAEPFRSRRRRCRHRRFGPYDVELPGVIESGMPRRNGQRKPGTTRGSPRRCRTAKALRISRRTAKSQCAHGWGGWGRLSDDDPRQHNLEPSEGPWGGGLPHLHGGARFERSTRHRAGLSNPFEVRERQTQTAHQPAYAGSRLKLEGLREGAALHASPPAVPGKTRRTE